MAVAVVAADDDENDSNDDAVAVELTHFCFVDLAVDCSRNDFDDKRTGSRETSAAVAAVEHHCCKRFDSGLVAERQRSAPSDSRIQAYLDWPVGCKFYCYCC